jgi:hypothetical protein
VARLWGERRETAEDLTSLIFWRAIFTGGEHHLALWMPPPLGLPVVV